MFILKKTNKYNLARRGSLKTRHGSLETPFFMPVATQATIKFASTHDVRELGSPILLSNTYHLMLRPGEKYVKKFGGLHKFMNWDGAILTDSGGFQIFSLAADRTKSGKSLVELSKQGVKFSSYIDGSKHYLTPERSLQIQADLGVDIAVVLDECVALPAKRKYLEHSVDLTTEWAKRTKIYSKKIKNNKPLIFAVVQGGTEKDLRLKSAAELSALKFDGYNIGGLAVGETNDEMYKVLDYLTDALPKDKPRYLMGVGYPENIIEAVKRGVDMFDCVIPTREGRHGRLFSFDKDTSKKIKQLLASKKVATKDFYKTITITNAKYANDKNLINKNSKIPELRKLSLAYLHYLFQINEPLGKRLATLNNLEFYLDLMTEIRKSI
ncbi:MAG: tRNA guanosine(34) transglycosylase Tgt [Candidatus Falkowbacteria bacterium]|nr:tRNA guanosine(34) transglycosylase Tgt [Candidatus Falkowbacteria bacterium]